MDIYQPAEDSYLINQFVKQYAIGRVLDMGTGSGIQALTAIKSPMLGKLLRLISMSKQSLN